MIQRILILFIALQSFFAHAAGCKELLLPQLDFARLAQDTLLLSGGLPFANGIRLQDRESEFNRMLARDWLLRRFAEMGVEAWREGFKKGANVAAEIRGSHSPAEVLEIGAHFDSIGPGADDNATGVALVLEIARLYMINAPERTLRFVLYDLEEVDSSGAESHAKEITMDPRKFLGAFIVDAIGYFPPAEPRPRVFLEMGRKDFSTPYIANEDLARLGLSGAPGNQGQVTLELKNGEIPGSRSDHGPFWSQKLPALLFSRPFGERYNSPHNHSPTDKFQNLNWEYYRDAARIFLGLVRGASRSQENAPQGSAN